MLAGLAVLPSMAEDTKGKWQFGFGLSYYATVDYIRSNSDIALSSGVVDESGLPPVQSVDERPDSNINNRPSINDDFKLDFNTSYGLTRWLAVEVAAGYLKSDLGNIEAYTADGTISFAGEGNPSTQFLCGEDPSSRAACYLYTSQPRVDTRVNGFLPVGQLTMIPLQLSGLVRFRPESPLDPYIGLGVGYLITSMDNSSEFIALGDELSARFVRTASRGEFTQQQLRTAVVDGQNVVLYPDLAVPAPGYHPRPLATEVRNGFEWHAVGGVDYYMNERFSVFIDARYAWTSVAVDITADGFHQVRLGAFDDGRLVLSQVGDLQQNPYLWEDAGVGQGVIGTSTFHSRCSTCRNDGLFETEDKNANGLVDQGEDDGRLYQLPAGSWDPGERIIQPDESDYIACPACVNNQQVGQRQMDTEDANYNQRLDRFLLYGIDICTTPEGVGNPICANVPADTINGGRRYVWPQGCPQSIPGAGQNAAAGTAPPEGCPVPPSSTANITATGVDDVSDVYLIQGGKVSLGGFSMGVGFQFTF